jgi:hypothetical protein
MRGQELNAIILDSLKQNPIPFASIYLKSGSGVVSNEEGRFRLQVDASETTDSLFISCMGYETSRFIPTPSERQYILPHPQGH